MTAEILPSFYQKLARLNWGIIFLVFLIAAMGWGILVSAAGGGCLPLGF